MNRRDLATDAELATRFAVARDQQAFAELVSRHGPMVREAARRMLRCEQDAEDVFQATFLAFASSAERLRRPGAVGAWLHETAVRSAKRLVRMNVQWKRAVQEKAQASPEAYHPPLREEVREVLDVELSRLPQRLRLAVILCDLEGLSRKDAAARLGAPISTVCNQVVEGRKLLCARLKRRGVACSVAGLAAAMGRSVEAAAPLAVETPHAVAGKAVRFAAGAPAEQIGISTGVYQLTQGVLTAMMIAKTSTVAVVALAAMFTFGAVGGVTDAVVSVARGGTLFLDDFEDGDFADGSPAAWQLILPPIQNYAADQGDFVLSAAVGSWDTAIAAVGNLELKDVSIRTQMTMENVLGKDDLVSLFVRGDAGDLSGYDATVSTEGIAYLRLLTPTRQVLDSASVSFDMSREDVILQLDVFGSQFEFWAWPAGEPRPEQPLLSATEVFYDRTGLFGIAYSPSIGTREGSGRFRWIQVSSSPIAANAMLPGDANVDGVVDLADFNLLKAAFGTNDPFTDFDGNGVVDLADFNILKTNFGAAAAVPEPGGVLLASLSGVGLWGVWRLRRRF